MLQRGEKQYQFLSADMPAIVGLLAVPGLSAAILESSLSQMDAEFGKAVFDKEIAKMNATLGDFKAIEDNIHDLAEVVRLTALENEQSAALAALRTTLEAAEGKVFGQWADFCASRNEAYPFVKSPKFDENGALIAPLGPEKARAKASSEGKTEGKGDIVRHNGGTLEFMGRTYKGKTAEVKAALESAGIHWKDGSQPTKWAGTIWDESVAKAYAYRIVSRENY